MEKQQKVDEDKSITFTSKRKTWEDILYRNRKDNPYSVEDEELRKFVSGRLEYWKAKEREEARWANWQKKFEENIEKIKEIEKDPDISTASKKEKWQELLTAYSKNNPYSEKDEQLRTYVKGRIAYLEKKKENPFGEKINRKAKRIYKNSKGFWEVDYGDGIVMVYIPAGEFTMGQTDEEKKWLIDEIGEKSYNDYYNDEGPLHKVYLDGYWMGKYEVTFGQYDKYCEETRKKKPDYIDKGRRRRPVIYVSWDDASAFCFWLSKKIGLRFMLPTEAQWEKAARGDDRRKYPWGDYDPYYHEKWYANYAAHNSWSKRGEDGFEFTAPVGYYPQGASPYGLMDMAGNVWEWCSDWYDSGYYKKSPDKNPRGPESGSVRVVRGGGWGSRAGGLLCAYRDVVRPSDRNRDLGFRLCQED